MSSMMLLAYQACDIESAMNEVRSLASTSSSAIGLVSPRPAGWGTFGIVIMMAVNQSAGTCPFSRHALSKLAVEKNIIS